ncbi:MAG: glycine cleavage T C-terminal barrel domain-containing protein [Gemmatimonadaceae bacterium]|nr:glycine cleavage T C-terminal barrel domain-containing protein [Gemmatimonadaceae bacterium]
MTDLTTGNTASALEGEYTALRTSAIVIDRSQRSRGTFGGAKGAEVLTGLVTNDVLALVEGTGCYAAALTPKGKIIADVRIFLRTADVLVDVPPRAAAGWLSMVKKYVNPRLSRYQDVSDALFDLSVYGRSSASILAKALGTDDAPIMALSDFGHVVVIAWGLSITVARVPDLGIDGFALFVPAAGRARAWEALQREGATPAGPDVFNVARIESGRPEWGIEMNENTLPQEANLDVLHAISYTKGCYTGQETVARIHFRGHVNRHLRGVRFDETASFPPGGELFDAAGKSVGEIRSVALSPKLGGVGLAMVRREVAMDSELDVRSDDGGGRARVVDLPFVRG